MCEICERFVDLPLPKKKKKEQTRKQTNKQMKRKKKQAKNKSEKSKTKANICEQGGRDMECNEPCNLSHDTHTFPLD